MIHRLPEEGARSESSRERLWRTLVELRSSLPRFKHPRKMMVHGLRQAIHALNAEAGAVAILGGLHRVADLAFTIPEGSQWNLGLLNDFLKLRQPAIPEDLILAQVNRRDRPWGVIAIRWPRGAVTSRVIGNLHAIAGVITEAIGDYDDDKVDELRHSVEHKIANRQRPKDTIYDIIHGLRDITQYNHSATLFVAEANSSIFELVAEQIAWTKAKSKRIGQRVELDFSQCGHLPEIEIGLFTNSPDGWTPSIPSRLSSVVERLAEAPVLSDGAPGEQCILCAYVRTPDGSLGILKVSSRGSACLGTFEAQLVERLMPMLSLVLQYLHRTEILEDQVLQAERKGALADISRGIAHDVNNALGSVIPLIQQIHFDIKNGSLRPDTLAEDLEVIESGLQTCRRIFGGLLASARSGDKSIGNGNIRRALDTSINVLRDRIRRQRIDLSQLIPSELPVVRGNQGDLSQVFLNLVANSLDAMNNGGKLFIEAIERPNFIEVVVSDDGCGIPEEILPRVTDPFVSTKQTGNGLGLSICRSIMWEIDGAMDIQSVPGKGTSIRLQFAIEDR